MTVVAVFLIFQLFIIVHEAGHFVTARLLGIGVEKVSLGFGPTVISFKTKRTLYRLGLIPLLGYVKIAGQGSYQDKNRDQALPDPDMVDTTISHFHEPWKRMLVTLSGPLFNILFCFLGLLLSNMVFGELHMYPQISAVVEAMPAAIAGVKPGDVIKSVDGVSIDGWMEMIALVEAKEGRAVKIGVEHPNGETESYSITPTNHLMGIRWAGKYAFSNRGRTSSFGSALNKTAGLVKATIAGYIKLFRKRSRLSGPAAITRATGQQVKLGFANALVFAMYLSVNIGIFNLLPVCPLDGGWLIIQLAELFKRSPLSKKSYSTINSIGGIIMLLVLIFAVIGDFNG